MRCRASFGALVGVAITAITIAGCGVAIQSSALPIKVPANLFQTPGVSKTPAHHGQSVDVFFLSNGHLVPSTRYLPAGHLTNTEVLQDTLNALSLGPTTSELQLGAKTAMSEFPPPQLSLLGSVTKGIAAVDLDSSFGNLDATDLYQADGQIAYTLTQFSNVTGVNFIFGGVREAWLPGGTVVYDQSVTRKTYAAIRPLTQ